MARKESNQTKPVIIVTDDNFYCKNKTTFHVNCLPNMSSNNVAFWQVQTQTSLCSLPLGLETPNNVWQVA